MYIFFEQSNYQAYLVGGAVRDILQGKNVSDWDVATDATPEQISILFNRVIPTGIAHGTVTVLFMGHKIEVTTFRKEYGYTDGRHPDKIEFGKDLKADLSRRDFTMNAIAASLKDGTLVDPFNGQNDIKSKIIRTVGNPNLRFSEDGLRPVRAVRFAAQLNFTIEENTLKAIPYALDKTATISVERFHDEFIKLLSAEKPSQGLILMEKTGILNLFLAELVQCRNIKQTDCRGIHKFDVLDHLFFACDGAPKEKINVRLAALFHDIGKPVAKRIEQRNGQQIITFYNHEFRSEEICHKIMTRLRFPKNQIEYVCHLVKNHMFHYESNWSDAAVRRFLVRVTPEALEDLFDLRIADVYGMTATAPILKEGPWVANLLELKDRIQYIIEKNTALCLKDLAINGKDLIQIGISPGKQIGQILMHLMETVLDDPECNTRDRLLEIAKKLNQNQISCK